MSAQPDPIDDDLILATDGPVGFITLNRPKALNALTTDMCHRLLPVLQQWGADDRIRVVVIEGAGEKAFCAGGDIVALYQGGMDSFETADPNPVAGEFFHSEYKVNRIIHHFPKPFVALVDGISMGGGFGLSVHGSHRVCTERTLFAMPETGIGLFPDVGGSWVLPRLPGKLGIFLGLTGYRAKAADTIYTGIGTHFLNSDKLDKLKKGLVKAEYGADPAATVTQVLEKHGTDPGEAPLAKHRKTIDKCFAAKTVEGIIDALVKADTDFAREIAADLTRMSPTSCAVSLAALRRGAKMEEFDAVMTMEYRVAMGRMRHPDFYEGVRAQLIDKDRKPRWSPGTLEAVSDEAIEAHFGPAPRELIFD